MDTVTKVTVTVPSQLVRQLRAGVKEGRARSVSAYITEAIEQKLDRDDAQTVLEEILAQHGEPTAQERAWLTDAVARTYGEK